MTDPLAPFRILTVNRLCMDPALDHRAMLDTKVTDPNGDEQAMLWEYIRTREERFLVFREGATPAWFHIKRLSAEFVFDSLRPIEHEDRRDRRAFCAGCHAVTMPNGDVLRPETLTGKPPEAGADWVQRIVDEFGALTVQEVGRAVHDYSSLPKAAHGPFSFPRG